MADEQKIQLLRLYLESLPDTLPQAEPEAAVNKFLAFGDFDAEWLDSIGEEMCVNRGIENALFGYGKRDDNNVFKITSRGPAVESMADVLECWLKKYPESEMLHRWLDSGIASAVAVILAHKEPVSTYPTTASIQTTH